MVTLGREKIKVNERARIYIAWRSANDPEFAWLRKLRNHLRGCLFAKSARKLLRTNDLIGCTPDKLRRHLESRFTEGMTWRLVMEGEVHIDHIKPCAAFDLLIPEEQQKCFHFSNLQPLWAKDNFGKNSWWEGSFVRKVRGHKSS